MILNPKLEHISLAALETLEYDILFLEKSLSKIDLHAQDSFIELKQVRDYGLIIDIQACCLWPIRKIRRFCTTLGKSQEVCKSRSRRCRYSLGKVMGHVFNDYLSIG